MSQKEKPTEKNEEVIFGELIATQLKRIPADERTLVKIKISNVMYSHLLKSNSQNQSRQMNALSSSLNVSSVNNPVFPDMPKHTVSQQPQQQINYLHAMEDGYENPIYPPGYVFLSSKAGRYLRVEVDMFKVQLNSWFLRFYIFSVTVEEPQSLNGPS